MDSPKFHPMRTFNLVLIVLVVALLAWSVLRPEHRTVAPPPEVAAPVAAAEPVAVAPTPRLPRPAPAESEPTLAPSAAPTEPVASRAQDLVPVRSERQALYEQLSHNNNLLFGEVQGVMGRAGVKDPAAIASAWMLAIHWGLREKSPDPAARRGGDGTAPAGAVDEARQKAVIAGVQAEIEALAGGKLDPAAWTELEALGRRYAVNEKDALRQSATPTTAEPGPSPRRGRRTATQGDE